MSRVKLSGKDAVWSEEISSPLEMKRIINMLESENVELREKLERLTDIIAPLIKQEVN